MHAARAGSQREHLFLRRGLHQAQRPAATAAAAAAAVAAAITAVVAVLQVKDEREAIGQLAAELLWLDDVASNVHYASAPPRTTCMCICMCMCICI